MSQQTRCGALEMTSEAQSQQTQFDKRLCSTCEQFIVDYRHSSFALFETRKAALLHSRQDICNIIIGKFAVHT